jgi:hypothetical protein
MTTKRFLIFVTALLGALSASGQDTLIYDQQSSTNEIAGPGSSAPISQFAPVGQSFTPSLSSVGFVRLWNADLKPGTGLGADIYVNLRSGSITGPVIGTSDTIDFPPFVFGNTNQGFAAFTNFVFSTPVTVTPGTQYFLQVVEASGGDWTIGAPKAYGYMGGDAIVDGIVETSVDFWFGEGIIQAPEPSSLALMAISGGVVAFWRRRRRTDSC